MSRGVFARDLGATLLALSLFLIWDISGADRTVMRWIGGSAGFPLRNGFWTASVLHEGGRLLAWVLLMGLGWYAWRAPCAALPGVPSRRERQHWFGVTLLCLIAVPTLKRFSPTSCPWDLLEFGGMARYVPHWQAWWNLGAGDAGPGHCFPSGHAASAFAFLSQYFLWRSHDMAHARQWLFAAAGTGVLFGLGQTLRGAHYPSHILWSAWMCWSLCAVAARATSHILAAGMQRPGAASLY